MSQCLGQRTLLLIYDGEGNSTQRGHLAECESCAARFRQLGHDLEAISRVLREHPRRTLLVIGFPCSLSAGRPPPSRWRWRSLWYGGRRGFGVHLSPVHIVGPVVRKIGPCWMKFRRIYSC